MAKKPGDLSFSFTASGKAGESTQSQRAPGGPPHRRFRILILSDFSGRTNRGVCEGDIGQRKVWNVDAENIDSVLAGVKAELQLGVDDKSAIPLAFEKMDDFRPDALLKKIPAFQQMLTLRGQFQNPRTFAQAAAVVRQLTGKAVPAASAAPETSGQSEFEKMLNRPIAAKNPAQASADAIIASLTAGYGVPAAEPDQEELVKLVEEAISAGLRAVLRHPAFQGLEAAWRGVAFLVSRLNTDAEVAINILDVSREELAADLAGGTDAAGLYAHLVERVRAPGSVPVSLVIGNYVFDQSEESCSLLAKIGSVVQAAGISFIAGGSAAIAGSDSFAALAARTGQWRPPANLEKWDQLRAGEVAANLGIAAPPFLLRLPYGKRTDAVDAFDFEEMPGEPVHEQYLWGNGAFALALLYGEAILENGFDGASNVGSDVSDLPCHMAMVAGDREMTPCAEAWLSERGGEILHSLGMIPLLSVRNAAAIKVAGIHSLARGQGLAGL